MNYAGIDYHKRYSVATVVNQDGDVIAQRSLDNRLDAFRAFLAPFGETEAVVEATRNWSVPVEILEQLVDRVVLAHPADTKIIAKRISTDKLDSQVLAQLLQAGWIPEAYLRDKANRDHQLVLRIRCFFVQLRTRIKNRIHDLIDRQAESVRETARTFSDLFGVKGLAWLTALQLEDPQGKLLTKLLAVYASLNQQIKESDELVKQLLESDSAAKLITSVPGFGQFFGVLVSTEVGDIKRFRDSSRFCSYAGLAPSTESSGGKTWHGSTMKQSNRWLRWAFVEAVIPAIVADADLRRFYERYRRTKGTKIAKVVTARRLACIVYRVMSQQSAYYPAPSSRLRCADRGRHGESK